MDSSYVKSSERVYNFIRTCKLNKNSAKLSARQSCVNLSQFEAIQNNLEGIQLDLDSNNSVISDYCIINICEKQLIFFLDICRKPIEENKYYFAGFYGMQNNCIYKFDVFFKIYNSIHLKLLKTNKNKCICSFRKTFKINYLKFKSSNNKKKQENPINFSKIISIRNIYSENEDFIDAFCFILS